MKKICLSKEVNEENLRYWVIIYEVVHVKKRVSRRFLNIEQENPSLFVFF